MSSGENFYKDVIKENEAKAQAVLEQYDQESKFRIFDNKILRYGVSALAIGLSLFHIYTAIFGPLVTLKHRSLHIGVIMCLIFLLYPFNNKCSRKKLNFFDLILAMLSISTTAYIFIDYLGIVNRGGIPSNIDILFASVTTLLVLEASRRIAGWELAAMALISILYAYLGPYFPGDFGHRGYSLSDIVNYAYVTTEGIYGDATAVSATYIILFIIFGAFLSKSGMGAFFNELALSVAGAARGGPAKVGVIASAIHGMINGSAVASAVTTGAFTIPLMKRIGYSPMFAAAVEATAACGGQILPPVMGAAAFIMAETLNIPYVKICIAAAIPAVLYYIGLLFQVHLRALKDDIHGLEKSELPKISAVMKSKGHLSIPLFVLVALLFTGYSPMLAASATIILTVVVAAIKHESRFSIEDILKALESGARDTLAVAIACASVGITVGIFTQTGLGLKLANIIIELGRNTLFGTLFWAMIASIILGLGLPSIPTYIITATMTAPALLNFGIEPIVSHLFVFYFGVIANLTPPVALAAFATAGIAGSEPQKTGWLSCKLAMAGIIVPFIFVYNPAMLILNSNITSIIYVTLISIAAILALAAATEGYFVSKMGWISRTILTIAGCIFMFPKYWLSGIGFLMIISVALYQYIEKRRLKA